MLVRRTKHSGARNWRTVMTTRRMLTSGLIVSTMLLSPFLVSVQSQPTQEPAAKLPPGIERMAARIDKMITGRIHRIFAGFDVEESFYLSRERAEVMRKSLAQGLGVWEEMKLRIRLARELLVAGESAAAIEELEEIRRISEERGLTLPQYYSKRVRSMMAISLLRLGEQENCILQHTIDSCIFPIREAGVHVRTRGSRGAIKELTAALEEKPDDLISTWLLNIAHMTLGEYPDEVDPRWLIPPETFDSDYDIGRFADVAPALGLDVISLAGGSIMEDFDGDGFLDLMASSSGLRDPLRYFRNNGDGTFRDLSESSGLSAETKSLNIFHADYNNDGYPDVLMLRGAWMHGHGRWPNSLLRNNGDNTFEDVTEQAGLLSFHPTQAAAWGDYDNDGWIDLFIGNESDPNAPHPSELFHNDGDGTFTQVARRLGVDAGGYVKGAAWGDYNNDGRPDLYVSRLDSPNLLFRNDGKVKAEEGEGPGGADWKFTDVTKEAGVAEPLKAFATWFWDYDNDGWEDLFVAGYYTESLNDIAAVYLGLPSAAERHRLYHNNGDGTFTDLTRKMRLDTVLLTMAANFGDLDNDGYLDCFFGTGEPDYRSLMPNRMLRNAEAAYFQDVTTSGGFGNLQKGHGIAFGDLDNDGDQDIYQVLGGAYSGDRYQNVLFENPGHGNRWLTLKLEGVRTNRAAIGARIRVRLQTEEGLRELYRTVGTGGSFGANSLQEEIGLGRARKIRSVEVTWPVSGKIQTFRGLEMDRAYRIREGDSQPVPLNLKSFDLSPEAQEEIPHHSPHPGAESRRRRP